VIWVLKYLHRADGRDDERQHGGAEAIASLERDLDQPVELVLGEDDVCGPCKYNHDGRCVDGLDWTAKIDKQEWVERRDRVAMNLLGVSEGTVLPAKEMFALFADRLPLLSALEPRHEDYEQDCRKGQRDQTLYEEGLRRVGQ
jgi:hypothetical protein